MRKGGCSSRWARLSRPAAQAQQAVGGVRLQKFPPLPRAPFFLLAPSFLVLPPPDLARARSDTRAHHRAVQPIAEPPT